MSNPDPSLKDLQEQLCDEFWHAGQNSGHLVRDCPHGITFFTNDEQAGDWAEGELEKLRERALKEPDKCVAVGSVHFTAQYGYEWSWDCEKCLKKAVLHQNFIWNHRDTISRYLNARLKSTAVAAAKDQQQNTIGKE